MASFKPRHYTAVSLNLVWFFISLFFVSQGTFVLLWSIFAVLALLLGSLSVWVLLTDRTDS